MSNNSKTINCPDCDGIVSRRATSCPHCGAPEPAAAIQSESTGVSSPERDTISVEQASDPTTDPALLMRAVHDGSPQIRTAVAANPATSADALRRLIDDVEETVREAAAASPNIPPDLIERLRDNPDPAIARGLANRHHTTTKEPDASAPSHQQQQPAAPQHQPSSPQPSIPTRDSDTQHSESIDLHTLLKPNADLSGLDLTNINLHDRQQWTLLYTYKTQ